MVQIDSSCGQNEKRSWKNVATGLQNEGHPEYPSNTEGVRAVYLRKSRTMISAAVRALVEIECESQTPALAGLDTYCDKARTCRIIGKK